MPDQAPNIDIESGKGGRLVYDKERRTIVAAPNERPNKYDIAREKLQATYNDLLALQGQTDQVPLGTALDAVGDALAALSRT